MTYTGTKWAERLNYLAEIEDGWYDGEGESVSLEVLDQADSILRALDSPDFNVPAMFPLLQDDIDKGGIAMEWSMKQSPHLLNLQISNSLSYEIFWLNFETRDYSLLEIDSFDEAMQTLRENLIRCGFASPHTNQMSKGGR